MKPIRILVGVLAVVAALSIAASGAVAVGDKDCTDFKNRQAAQKFFKKHGGNRHNDPFQLDDDHDGKACETLPTS